MGKIIGIDLGTTNSLVAVWENNQSVLIPNALNEYLTPSVVNIEDDGTINVGKVAKDRLVTDPQNTVSVFKRFMGTDKKLKLGKKSYTPEELSSFVLRKLKEDAEAYLGEEVEEAIISVPAYFEDKARRATKQAGALAGLKVDRIVNEPSAAALAYKDKENIEEGSFLVFDFGGGTLDVSVVDIFDNIIEILSVAGDNKLGGSDFDRVIGAYFCRQNNLEMNKLTAREIWKINEAAEEAKISLTENEETLMQVKLGEEKYELLLSRETLIGISKELFMKILIPVRKAVNGIQISTEINGIVLVGGSSIMPVVQMYLKHVLKKEEIKVYEPNYMIAYGLGVYAGIMERQGRVKDYLLTDVCPFSLGTQIHNDNDPSKDIFSPIIQRNSSLPTSKEEIYKTVYDFQEGVRIQCYQGDSYYAEDNTFLGELMLKVPIAPKGKEKVKVRFSYDINGILMVDATVLSTGETKSLLLTGDGNLSEEELNKRIKVLNEMKIHPREQEENKLILQRLHRLFEECNGIDKNEVERRTAYFEYILSIQDLNMAMRARVITEKFLEYMEQKYGIIQDEDEQFDNFREWYRNGQSENDVEELDKEEEMFLNWFDGYYTS